jgi:hypothetical protein
MLCSYLMHSISARSNANVEDFTNYDFDLNDCSDTFGAKPTVCETEVSPRCPYSWAYYADADGSEGTDSCVYISPSTVTSWGAANSSCPAGSHLLTVKSASSSSGLLPFATSLYHGSGQRVYIGCRSAIWDAVMSARDH